MEVFNKFYSSVSNTVSQLSGVLPGNPVTREFEATQFIASAGPGLLWKIYKGYKKSTKQEASIFVFEKKLLDRFTKADRDIMLETLKRGIVQLTKLRHPQILTVQHSLEESRESLAFATEPVFASLANILGNMENMPQPAPNHLTNYKLYELEIKYGLMQIAEGLAFLHNDVKLLHHNICPESIIVNQQGAWKIFGFDFCIANQSSAGAAPYWPFNEYCQAMHALTQPSLDYLGPEYVLSASHSPASDIYSLGMLIYATHSPNHQTLGNVGNDYGRFKRFANELRNLSPSRLSCVADGLREYVKLMLNVTPELRPDPHQFLKIPYFEDVGVKTLNYLDSLFQWDNLQKSQFYKGLPQIIQKMPHRICIYRILPCLTKEFVNAPMVPFVLPNVLLIAENSTKEEYIKYILPVLKPVMLIQDPIQILLIFMQKMELLLKLTPGDEVKTDILPMLYRALESDAQQIQELCLSVLPTFASLIDYPAMKNALLPRIKKLCLNTSYLAVRVNCLLCIGKLLEHLDKWLVLDEVIPFLPQVPSREPAVLMGILEERLNLTTNRAVAPSQNMKNMRNREAVRANCLLCIGKLGHLDKWLVLDEVIPFLPLVPSREPAVLMGILGIYKLALSHQKLGITKEVMATKVLPFLMPLCVENGLTLSQFNALVSLVKLMVGRVEAEHRAKLEQLNSIQNESKGMESLVNSGAPSETLVAAPAQASDMESLFTGLGLQAAPSASAGSLSIEDKQRIAQQQKVVQKINQLPPPTPVAAPTPPRPRDLTSSLLQSNLNQLSTKPTPQYNINTQSTPQYNPPLQSPATQPQYQQFNQIQSPSSTQYNHIQSPISSYNPTSQPQYNLQMTPNYQPQNQNSQAGFPNSGHWTSPTSGNFNNKWASNQNNQVIMKQDWSAFESLLPTAGNENGNVKKSDNEMMDLLS